MEFYSQRFLRPLPYFTFSLTRFLLTSDPRLLPAAHASFHYPVTRPPLSSVLLLGPTQTSFSRFTFLSSDFSTAGKQQLAKIPVAAGGGGALSLTAKLSHLLETLLIGCRRSITS